MRMIKIDLYCPNCGRRGIWQDADDAGDYYEGTPMQCFVCDRSISDISVDDPKDPRHGAHSVEFWGSRFDEMKRAALGK